MRFQSHMGLNDFKANGLRSTPKGESTCSLELNNKIENCKFFNLKLLPIAEDLLRMYGKILNKIHN